MEDKEKPIEEKLTEEQIVEILKKRIDAINPWETHALEYHKGLLNLINGLKAENESLLRLISLIDDLPPESLKDVDKAIETIKAQERKETAEKYHKFINNSIKHALSILGTNKPVTICSVIRFDNDEIAKQFGVETEIQG